jgi:hypothetical protein
MSAKGGGRFLQAMGRNREPHVVQRRDWQETKDSLGHDWSQKLVLRMRNQILQYRLLGRYRFVRLPDNRTAEVLLNEAKERRPISEHEGNVLLRQALQRAQLDTRYFGGVLDPEKEQYCTACRQVKPVKRFNGGWIETYTGRAFQPMNPDPLRISIRDIAHALSFKCRYTGHCSAFYSVAEHSVLMAGSTIDREVAQWCLLHDATEAYLPDVPRPLKPYIPGWAEIENRVEVAVAKRFQLRLPKPDVVKTLDTRILLTEAADLLPSRGEKWEIDARPLDVRLEFWAPPVAEGMFLRMYDTLFPFITPLPKMPAWDTTSTAFDPYK